MFITDHRFWSLLRTKQPLLCKRKICLLPNKTQTDFFLISADRHGNMDKESRYRMMTAHVNYYIIMHNAVKELQSDGFIKHYHLNVTYLLNHI